MPPTPEVNETKKTNTPLADRALAGLQQLSDQLENDSPVAVYLREVAQAADGISETANPALLRMAKTANPALLRMAKTYAEDARRAAAEIARLETALNAAQNQGWISVKDRLPDKSGTFLTYVPGYGVQLGYWSDLHDVWGVRVPTYWMPLPAFLDSATQAAVTYHQRNRNLLAEG